MFDTHNKGVIDTKELKDTMLSLGYQEKNKMILHMIRRIEKSGDSLNFEQFLNLMTAKIVCVCVCVLCVTDFLCACVCEL